MDSPFEINPLGLVAAGIALGLAVGLLWPEIAKLWRSK